MTIAEILRKFMDSLLLETSENIGDIEIISPKLYNLSLDEFMKYRIAKEPYVQNGVLSLYYRNGTIKLHPEMPKPREIDIQRAVFSELNQREINRQKYGIKNRKKTRP